MVREKVYEHYLPKRVVKCSACEYVTFVKHEAREDVKRGAVIPVVGALRDHLTSHIDSINERIARHAGADAGAPILNDRGVASQICSGCGNQFQVGLASQHIEQIRIMSVIHQGVEALVVNRFALEPSEPTIFYREVVVAGPEVNQVAPIASPRKGRRRKRGRRGNRG